MEYIQYVSLNSICKGAAVKLKNFQGDGQLSVLFTVRNSFLYKTLNEILEKLIPAGIPQYLIKYHEVNLYGSFVPTVVGGPNVLTIEDLTYGFVLWLGACGVSVAAFLIEILCLFVTIWLKKFIRLWTLQKFLEFKLFPIY